MAQVATRFDDAGHSNKQSFDVVVVGAGFAGLYMLHKLRAQGLSVRVIEAAAGVGGTWYWNRYPGARVDIQSLEYSYSFSPELESEWCWTERYATQPELLRYINHVADRFDLRRDIAFETRVLSQHFDETDNRWIVTTDKGDLISAHYCIMATGCLSAPKDIDITGQDQFKGPTYRTSRWPHEGVDFTGLKVGVIGTGSSGIQAIPEIAKQAAHITVFQRTPAFSLPARNGPLDPRVVADWKANAAEYRAKAKTNHIGQIFVDDSGKLAADLAPEERLEVMEDRWARGGFAFGGCFADMYTDPAANDVAAEFLREKIRGIVTNPLVAETLSPRSYPLFTKRPCVDSDYFAAYNRQNIALVDLTKTPITTITETGLRTTDADFDFDAIVYAIGFDAMTGALNAIDIRGRGGEPLKSKWAAGPNNYIGMLISGFPNLFLITGPGSPSVLSNMVSSIEDHVEWISDCISYLGERNLEVIEATAEAEAAWVARVNEEANNTLFPAANSWFIGANIPGKPRVFMPYVGGVPAYRQKCDEVVAGGYLGCVLT